MKKSPLIIAILACVALGLTGCSSIGEKAMSLSAVYAVTAILAIAILASYLILNKRKLSWFILLLSAIAVTNTGYWFLSTAKTLEAALMANRISYLGSVFLPMSMLMIILKASKTNYSKYLPLLLAGVSLLVFLVAASPGYSDIYYAEVSLVSHNGVSALEKVYGPWHRLYLFFLLGYFMAIIGVSACVIYRKKISNTLHAVILSLAVFVNIGVWLLEQLVKIEFELLSVSYILSELFLIGLDLLLQEQQKHELPAEEAALVLPEETPAEPETIPLEDKAAHFAAQLATLTPTERKVYEQYLAGKTTKEIMENLAIKENTLKYHNRNLYSKLGVSSRKQMLELASLAKAPSTASCENEA